MEKCSTYISGHYWHQLSSCTLKSEYEMNCQIIKCSKLKKKMTTWSYISQPVNSLLFVILYKVTHNLTCSEETF